MTSNVARTLRYGSTENLVKDPLLKHGQLSESLRCLVVIELTEQAPTPSEREPAPRYRVSRLTARSAIGRLVGRGVLYRVLGKGTVRVNRSHGQRLRLTSFPDERGDHGAAPTNDARANSTGVPAASHTRTQGRADSAQRITRLRREDGVRLTVKHGWYHPDQLATHGAVLVTYARQTVWAEAADTTTAHLLAFHVESPLLGFRRVSSTKDKTVEDTASLHRGDHHQLTMQLGQDNPRSENTGTYGGRR